MSSVVGADYAVVVSIAKSGTNLVAKLLELLGYTCIGHGLRESHAKLWETLQELNNGKEDPKVDFSRPDRLLRALKAYPKNTCLFLHKFEIGPYLLDWCRDNEPRVIFNYRDPRDTLISQMNYLLLQANDKFTEMPWNVIFARVLANIKDPHERIMFAIRHMQKDTNRFRENVWMLHDPNVCSVAYEALVGPRGGGSSDLQREALKRIMVHLGAQGSAEELCENLYDPSSRTFFRGQIGMWLQIFSSAHSGEFERLYGDVLSAYGYPPGQGSCNPA